MGRTTLSEVEDDLVPGEDDLSGNVIDDSQLEGERRRRELMTCTQWQHLEYAQQHFTSASQWSLYSNAAPYLGCPRTQRMKLLP